MVFSISCRYPTLNSDGPLRCVQRLRPTAKLVVSYIVLTCQFLADLSSHIKNLCHPAILRVI